MKEAFDTLGVQNLRVLPRCVILAHPLYSRATDRLLYEQVPAQRAVSKRQYGKRNGIRLAYQLIDGRSR